MRLNNNSPAEKKIYTIPEGQRKFLIFLFFFLAGIFTIGYFMALLYSFNKPNKIHSFGEEFFIVCIVLLFWFFAIKIYKKLRHYSVSIDDDYLTITQGDVSEKLKWEDIKEINHISLEQRSGIQIIVKNYSKRENSPFKKLIGKIISISENRLFILDDYLYNFKDLIKEIIKRAVNAEIDEETRKWLNKNIFTEVKNEDK